MKKLALTLFLSLWTSSVFAQVFVFRIDPTPVMTTAGNVPIGGYPIAYLVPGATIKLCTNSTCSALATTYTDSTGGTSCPTSAQVTLPGTSVCTPTAGTQGQFGFWIQPGTYYFTVTTSNGTFGPYPLSSPTLGTLGGPGIVSANAAGGLSVVTTVLDCSVFAGSAASDKIKACLAALPASGGVADASNFIGAQNLTSIVTVGASQTLKLGYALYTCSATSTECITLSGENAKLIGPSQSFIALTQSSGAYGQSVVSLTATGAIVDSVGVSAAGVLSGHENDEEVACFHIKGASYPASISNITVQNSYCNELVSGIWSYNGASSFKLTHVVLKNNILTSSWDGIYIGGYGQNAVVNNDILVEDNNIQIPATQTTTAAWYNSRPLQVVNTNNLRVIHNFTIGGYSGPETYAHPNTNYELDVKFLGNTSDDHNGFTQVNGGEYVDNRVDNSLRPASWISYDNAAFVAVYGNLAGIEAASSINISVTGNTVNGSYGPCIDFSSSFSTLSGNTFTSCSQSVNRGATWPSYSGGILLNYGYHDSAITGNMVNVSGTSGIKQIGSDFLFAQMTHLNITGNVIYNTQQHGIHLRNIVDSNVSNNTVSNPNLAASTYNAIDFTADGGGETYVVSGIAIVNNITSGGTYGVYQPLIDAASNRKNYVAGNLASGATTAPFLTYDHRHDNQNGAGLGNVITVGAGSAHVSVNGGFDFNQLDDGGGAKTVYFIDDGSIGDVVTFRFLEADITIESTGNLVLAAGGNVTPTLNSTMTFICIQNYPNTGQQWNEVSRSIH